MTNLPVSTPTHVVEIEMPETWGGGTKSVEIYGGLDAAIGYVRSKLGLSAEIELKHKHIYRVREYGAAFNDWVYTAAG